MNSIYLKIAIFVVSLLCGQVSVADSLQLVRACEHELDAAVHLVQSDPTLADLFVRTPGDPVVHPHYISNQVLALKTIFVPWLNGGDESFHSMLGRQHERSVLGDPLAPGSVYTGRQPVASLNFWPGHSRDG